jgi:hypothetical protein
MDGPRACAVLAVPLPPTMAKCAVDVRSTQHARFRVRAYISSEVIDGVRPRLNPLVGQVDEQSIGQDCRLFD